MKLFTWTLALVFLLACGTAYGQQSGALSQANAQQVQGQTQSQGNTQSVVTPMDNIGNSALTVSGSFNGADPIAIPAPAYVETNTQGGPAMFGRPNYESTGPNFMSMENLAGALNAIDLDQATIADEGDIELVAQPINLQLKAASKFKVNEKIEFKLNKVADVTRTFEEFSPMAIVTLKASDNDTMNSATLAVALAKYARSIKANKIVLVQEGVVKRLSSWGAGIGLAYNAASIATVGDNVGSVGAGGTGWSMGQAEFFSLPYLTAVVGR